MTFILIAVMMNIFCKRPLNSVTDAELDAIHGIKISYSNGRIEGKRAMDIIRYIAINPDCEVEDLRVIDGIDDMIIDQLKRRFR